MSTAFEQHPSRVYEAPIAAPGAAIRTVLLGQHPERVRVLAGMLNEAGVDCGVILNAQIPKINLLICGGYFELQDVQDMLAEVANDELRLLKVPEGLMMEGGGPPAVMAWLHEQVEKNEFTLIR
ncbi:hypothetical protein JCM10213v2_008408 [Rhodosporidiobolus nylandii]